MASAGSVRASVAMSCICRRHSPYRRKRATTRRSSRSFASKPSEIGDTTEGTAPMEHRARASARFAASEGRHQLGYWSSLASVWKIRTCARWMKCCRRRPVSSSSRTAAMSVVLHLAVSRSARCNSTACRDSVQPDCQGLRHSGDTAIYDRVEVLRGPSGLFAGALDARAAP